MVNNTAAVMVQMRNSNSSWEMYTFLKNLEIPVNISGISGQLFWFSGSKRKNTPAPIAKKNATNAKKDMKNIILNATIPP